MLGGNVENYKYSTLLTDIDMYRFIQSSIGGGLVQCCYRYTKAYNKYLSDYDSSKESSFLMYMDANNLYGWAMTRQLVGDPQFSTI